MGSEQVFYNITFKRMTALRQKIQSCHRLFFELLFLDLCDLKQSLTMIVWMKLL